MRVQVLFFGMLKEITGLSQEDVEVGAGCTLGDVLEQYCVRFPRLREVAGSIVVAQNRQFAPRSAAVGNGDEIAMLPPVSGGSGQYSYEVRDAAGHFFALTREPIDTRWLEEQVVAGCDGAVLTFAGVVRNNSKGRQTRYLDYECYEPMAIEVMAQLGRRVAASHSISKIAMVHRLGRMEIGEASVVIVVASPHRKAAYDASLEAINQLKRTVPVWKKEYFTDGEVWVEGEWDDSLLGQ